MKNKYYTSIFIHNRLKKCYILPSQKYMCSCKITPISCYPNAEKRFLKNTFPQKDIIEPIESEDLIEP